MFLCFPLLSACNVWIWTTITMSLCHSQVGLSGIGTGPLVVFDAADHVGTGPCPLMGTAWILPSCVVEFSSSSYLSHFFSQLCLKFWIYFCYYTLLNPMILPMLHCSGAWTASLCLAKVSPSQQVSFIYRICDRGHLNQKIQNPFA